MRVVVLGSTGGMGRRVGDLLRDRGHEIVGVSRSGGVDVLEPGSLVDVLRGADCVVDCLNRQTLSRRTAVDIFTRAARNISVAADVADVPHLVVVSIVNVTDPAVVRSAGYYAGKAAQEGVYATARRPVSIVRTTAWFTLAETFLRQLRLGPVAVVPRMALQPVHPDAVAGLVADVVDAGPTTGPADAVGCAVHELAGPERTDAVSMARAVAARRGGARVLGMTAPSAGMRRGLLPGPDVRTDDRRFSDWVRTSGR